MYCGSVLLAHNPLCSLVCPQIFFGVLAAYMPTSGQLVGACGHKKGNMTIMSGVYAAMAAVGTQFVTRVLCGPRIRGTWWVSPGRCETEGFQFGFHFRFR